MVLSLLQVFALAILSQELVNLNIGKPSSMSHFVPIMHIYDKLKKGRFCVKQAIGLDFQLFKGFAFQLIKACFIEILLSIFVSNLQNQKQFVLVDILDEIFFEGIEDGLDFQKLCDRVVSMNFRSVDVHNSTIKTVHDVGEKVFLN